MVPNSSVQASGDINIPIFIQSISKYSICLTTLQDFIRVSKIPAINRTKHNISVQISFELARDVFWCDKPSSASLIVILQLDHSFLITRTLENSTFIMAMLAGQNLHVPFALSTTHCTDSAYRRFGNFHVIYFLIY